MKIGELAQRARVSTKAVRHYESLGLITPVRLANGYRDFSETDVRLVIEVRSLGTLGIAVERTRPFLECLAAGNENADECPASMAGYRDAISELTERIEALTTRREILVRRLQKAARVVETPPSDLPVPNDGGGADHLPGRRMPGLVFPSTDGRHERLGRLGSGTSIVYLYPLTGRPDVD